MPTDKQTNLRRRRAVLRPILAACALLAGPARADTRGAARTSARDILDATGVRGGLVVLFGCRNAELTAALRASDSYVVHALDADADNVENARKHIRALGLYGEVSAERWRSAGLPYVDSLVNLFVGEGLHGVPMAEVLRVLAPGGVAYIREAGAWTKTVKPRPEGIDDWTHSFYDASNNAVGKDTVVAPPYHMQWVAGPRNTRSHEHGSVSAAVSAAGRLFYIVDEASPASTSLPSQWFTVARDAFSGVLLWKRPIPRWEPHPAGLYKGPPEISRRLVASGERLYVTLGARAPVTALDAATGQTAVTYEGTEGTGEVLLHEGRLFLAAAGPVARGGASLVPMAPPGAAITVLYAATGGVVWKKPEAEALSGTLAVGSGRVFYVDSEAVVCLDAATGQESWRTEHAGPRKRLLWRTPSLVVHDSVVLCADRRQTPGPDIDEATGKPLARWLANAGAPGDLTAYSADTGKKLWSCKCAESYYTPVDVFVNNGLVWVGQSRARQGPDFTVARDLLTGEIKHRIDTAKAFQTTMPHHRCHRDRATSRYLVTGRTGVEFIDFETGESFRHHWVRGVCRFGVIPCNGLLYAPPHSCACFIEAKLVGFNALAPASPTRTPPETIPEDGRLERGPAYTTAASAVGDGEGGADGPEQHARDDWPAFRHDSARTGGTDSPVAGRLMQVWQQKLGGRLSSPVIGGGRLFVVSVDTHTVHVLDAAGGGPLWHYTAGGRIDSPPTLSKGLVVFGSADGWVHCLRADDGELVWRYRAAPMNQRLVSFGQLESVWPVHGSVLVEDDVVTCTAGRSSYLDSGIYLSRLDLRTGRKLTERRLFSRDPETGEQPGEPIMFEMPGALPDVLSSDGELVYMRRLGFDPASLQTREAKPHLYSPAGFLNSDWWHRNYWIFGEHFYSGYIGWRFAGLEAPAGRLLVLDSTSIYGFARESSRPRASSAQAYQLFATDRKDVPVTEAPDYTRASRGYSRKGPRQLKVKFRWTASLPILVRAMLRAGDTLFAAGPPDNALRSAPAFEGQRGGGLCAVSAADGKALQDYRLDSPPVFDGMAAANGRLFLTTEDGQVLCLGDGQSVQDAKELVPFSGRTPRPLSHSVKEPGLVGHWTFDEGAGGIAQDSSGLQNDAEIHGRWVKGTFGTCILTESTPGAVTVRDSELLHVRTASFSFEFWVKPDAFDCRLLGKEDYPRTWWGINILENGRTELVLAGEHQKGKAMLRPVPETPLSTVAWTHVAYVIDREQAEVRCYFNGTLDLRTPIPPAMTGSLSVEGTDLMIPSSYKPFAGLFDELKIFRRPLTDAQVQASYQREEKNRTSVAFEYAE